MLRRVFGASFDFPALADVGAPGRLAVLLRGGVAVRRVDRVRVVVGAEGVTPRRLDLDRAVEAAGGAGDRESGRCRKKYRWGSASPDIAVEDSVEMFLAPRIPVMIGELRARGKGFSERMLGVVSDRGSDVDEDDIGDEGE